MAYDPGLVARIRDTLGNRANVAEKKMFGGVAFLLDGHMFVGVAGDELMARVGPAAYAAALARDHVREMDFTGKPMKGYVFVAAEGLEDDRQLAKWLHECLEFVSSLPPKSKG